MMIVAASGSGKTTLVEILDDLYDTHSLEDISPHTLFSGTSKKGKKKEEISLIYTLNNKLVIIKDFAPILSKGGEDKKKIFSQFRQIYDGKANYDRGTGIRHNWKGRISFIACVTPEIDKHFDEFGDLGERFIVYRPILPTPKQAGKKAMENEGKDEYIMKKFRTCVNKFFKRLSIEDIIHFPNWNGYEEDLLELAELATIGRTPLKMNPYSKSYDYLPSTSEFPTRIVKQVKALVKGMWLNGVKTNDIKQASYKIIRDCIPRFRRALLEIVHRYPGRKKEEIAELLCFDIKSVANQLEDMRYFERPLIKKKMGRYVITPEFEDVVDRMFKTNGLEEIRINDDAVKELNKGSGLLWGNQ
jgi:hypothetical protein